MAVDTPPVRADGLQIEEKRDFQEQFWTIERVAWIGFAILLLIAVAGFTGAGGLLSQRTVSMAGAEFEYPLVTRRQAAETLGLTFTERGQHRVVFSPQFSQSLQLEGVQPQPVEERAGPEGLALEFEAAAGGVAHLHVRPRAPSLASFQIQVGDGERRTVRMLILP